jgi:hypothetical protein
MQLLACLFLLYSKMSLKQRGSLKERRVDLTCDSALFSRNEHIVTVVRAGGGAKSETTYLQCPMRHFQVLRFYFQVFFISNGSKSLIFIPSSFSGENTVPKWLKKTQVDASLLFLGENPLRVANEDTMQNLLFSRPVRIFFKFP